MTSLEHVTFSYGAKTIFQNFSWEFPAGSTTAVTGPSGAGKTTLLGLLTGRLKPERGSVHVDCPIAVMFQEPRLLPWFTVQKNIALVSEGDRVSDGDNISDGDKVSDGNMISPGPGNQTAARKWLSLVHLEAEADHFPDSLSGGMQQRVSLARLLAYAHAANASLIILDEPFSALDPQLHAELRARTMEILKGKTVILITHDPEDARVCDRQLVLGSIS